ncbi:hypothetical protein KPH14_011595 [Odynerus spinipes]|uniref:Presequence protease, mitochondrial n=1 Tax=Odynerus spinipes TaxID=1348599 RepID=A0AAD9RH46_9HYME|nr:hypothetical protein KPH14_011595 [Odynerus spinipes]
MTPVDNTPTENMGGFELVCSLKANDVIPVHKYKSKNTGLTVFIAEVDGPIVGGYFCLATEAFDDDGLPHTLEHLVFMGSENYPYKGILDLMANRCLASGTNAATDTDHTFYTMTTAGSEGFLSLMPIYLEHILYPTLQDSAYLTEVHHITGEGEDAGVVYCEMQGKENIGEYLVFTELCRAAYPGHCGYKSQTGGALQNLRESTSNEKVRNYHKEFYRPENLTIIITGQVKHDKVFKTLQPLEQMILSKGPRGPFERPWQNPVPPLTESVDLDLFYPCDDEDNGIVTVGWRGPSAVHEVYELTACSLLLKYLTDTSVSPLQKEFVEIEDPYASNVLYSLSENSISLLYVIFENVPKPKIPLVKDRLLDVLKQVNESGIDMKRMKTVVHRNMLETLSNLENCPHDSVAYMIIGDVLYGNTKEDLDQRLNQIRDIKKLFDEPEAYWLNLLKKYLIDAPIVTVKGIPSIEKQHQLMEEEKVRVAKQIEGLGEEGLQKKETELQEAVVENKKPIPDELLTAISIPSTDSINFHQIKSYSTETREQHSYFDVTKLPLFTYLDHVNTNFVYMFVIMDTSSIGREHRLYLPLLLEAIMECPVKRNGQLIPYEEVVAELEADTAETRTYIGVDGAARFSCGLYSHSATLMLQLEPSKYQKGVQWIKELLYETELISDRLKIIATKMINDVAQVKRQGSRIVKDLMKSLTYNKDSNYYASSLLRQQKFLTKMIERLNDESSEQEVKAEIESVRKILTSTRNMVLYMAANVDKLAAEVDNVYAPWNDFFSDMDITEKKPLNVTTDWQLLSLPGEISSKGCVTGLGCIDSAFLIQSCPSINDFQSDDLASLLVCLQYLNQTEGPMWRLIRGQGLSYGYGIYPKPNEGLLYFSLYRSTNVVAAYKEAKNIAQAHLSKDKWETLLFESAKSSLIFEIIQKEKTVCDVVQKSLLSYFMKVPHDYNNQMVRRISTVVIEDLTRVANRYIKPLFEPTESKTTVVCHPSKAPEVAAAFNELGHKLEIYNSLEETFLNE